jgi:hypothetical protein
MTNTLIEFKFNFDNSQVWSRNLAGNFIASIVNYNFLLKWLHRACIEIFCYFAYFVSDTVRRSCIWMIASLCQKHIVVNVYKFVWTCTKNTLLVSFSTISHGYWNKSYFLSFKRITSPSLACMAFVANECDTKWSFPYTSDTTELIIGYFPVYF